MKNNHRDKPSVVVYRHGIETPDGFEHHGGMGRLIRGAQHYQRIGFKVEYGRGLPSNYRAELSKTLRH